MSKNNVIDFKDIKSANSKIDTDIKINSLPKNKQSKLNFKNVCLLVVIIIAILYPAAYIGNQFVTLAKFESEIKNLKSELEETKARSKSIQEEIDGAKSNEFIEKMAREKLKMVKKDEIVYVKIE
ncbi:MAG: septum formation initiator family protein [Proteocatella sp.]